MAKRSDLAAAQRPEVVSLLLRREAPAGKLARRFGISEQTLYRWRDEFLITNTLSIHPQILRKSPMHKQQIPASAGMTVTRATGPDR